jgi:hypothetical protein
MHPRSVIRYICVAFALPPHTRIAPTLVVAHGRLTIRARPCEQ